MTESRGLRTRHREDDPRRRCQVDEIAVRRRVRETRRHQGTHQRRHAAASLCHRLDRAAAAHRATVDLPNGEHCRDTTGAKSHRAFYQQHLYRLRLADLQNLDTERAAQRIGTTIDALPAQRPRVESRSQRGGTKTQPFHWLGHPSLESRLAASPEEAAASRFAASAEEEWLDLPQYDIRRYVLAKDPLAAMEAFRVYSKVVLASLHGTRMCPACPHCARRVWTLSAAAPSRRAAASVEQT